MYIHAGYFLVEGKGGSLVRKGVVTRLYMQAIHAGYFLVGGRGGIFPPLTAVFPPFRLAVIIVYYIFQKIIQPQDPPTTG